MLSSTDANAQTSTARTKPMPADRTIIRWLLFISFIHTIPSPWFYLVAAGLAPTTVLLAVGLYGTFWITETTESLALFVFAPSLVYTLLYFGIAHLLATVTARIRRDWWRSALLGLICVPLFIAAFLPIYPWAGHGPLQYASILDLWTETQLPTSLLSAYTAAVVALVATLLVLQHLRRQAPPLTVRRLWGTRSGKAGFLTFALACSAGFVYVNHVLLLCLPLAEVGVTRAQVCMGRALRGPERNPFWGDVDARTWFERAAQQGDAEAIWLLHQMATDAVERVGWLRMLAQNGDAGAQYQLAELLRRDRHNEEHREEAWRWLVAAADHGHAEAQYELGRTRQRGSSDGHIGKDLVKSRQRLNAAARQGHRRAMELAAGLYERGNYGFPLELDKAKRLYHQLAKSDAPTAQMIGLQSFSERAAAIEDLQRRLRDGDPEAMRTLALRHLEAFEPAAGATEQGIALLTETAQRDDAEAQYLLGEILVFGRYRVTKNMERGAEWWRRAAENGHLRATERIAYATATGNHGQQADYAQAKPWIEQLIRAYREGRLGASIDRVKARRWEDELKFIERQYQRLGHEFLPLEPLRTQAATNDAQAQFQLAQQLFATSQMRNGKEAVGLYTQAARSGHVQAQMKLFQLYRRGLSFTSTANPGAGPQVIVAKDEHRAIAYLAQAADAHHPQAMAELALAYEKGRYGLTQDYLKAKSLYAQILEAAADNRYDWDVDERFLSMQRIRLQACTRILEAQAKH